VCILRPEPPEAVIPVYPIILGKVEPSKEEFSDLYVESWIHTDKPLFSVKQGDNVNTIAPRCPDEGLATGWAFWFSD